MGAKTGIEWCDATWNPWMGCRKVSAGCKNCYMFRDMKFYGRDPDIVVKASASTFNNPMKWKVNRKLSSGSRIFTCSWSDFFIEEADEWRYRAWDIIKHTPEFTYIILTKRPERILGSLPMDWTLGYPNVWLLISAENQSAYDERWKELAAIPAAIRGVSAEPLLGPIQIPASDLYYLPPDWVITGGESDKNSPRSMDPDWARSLRDQCQAAGISFFHKQNGGAHRIDGAWGGRNLDGIEWSEFPKARIAAIQS
jgi:protein gp37